MEITILNSPVQAVIAKLKVGTVLGLRLAPGNMRRLEAVHNGVIAGAITSPAMAQIIACIGQGHTYKATVLSIAGGRCEIRIEPQ